MTTVPFKQTRRKIFVKQSTATKDLVELSSISCLKLPPPHKFAILKKNLSKHTLVCKIITEQEPQLLTKLI